MSEERVTLNDKLADELDRALDHAEDNRPVVEPTDEEKRNGWTAEELTEYIASREAGQALSVDPHSLHRRTQRRPTEQKHKYLPHYWRE